MVYPTQRGSGCTVLLARIILMLLIFSAESFTFSLGSSLNRGSKAVVAMNNVVAKTCSPRAKLLVNNMLDDVHSKIGQEFPRPKSIYDRLVFGWVKDLMVKGNQKPLELGDIWLLEEKKRMRSSSEAFERLFEIEKDKSTNKLRTTEVMKMNILLQFWESPITRAIVSLYWKELVTTGLMKLVNTFVQFVPSLVIARILKYVSNPQQAPSTTALSALFPSLALHTPAPVLLALDQVHGLLHHEGLALSLLLFFFLCAKTFIENQYFDAISQMSAQIRGTLSTAVYRKALRLSAAGRQNNTLGEVVNYMQLDTSRLEQVAHNIHTVWDGALQIVGYTFLLVQFLGPSVFAGIAAMFVVLPLNSYFLRRISKQREANLKHTDRRVRLTSELLAGIRAVKSYNWEAPFLRTLHATRSAELEGVRRAANMRALFVAVLGTAPSLVAVSTLCTYALLGHELNPTRVFTSLGLFNQLRFPLIFYPMLLNTLAEGKVSLGRLTRFLLADEVQGYVRNGDTDDLLMSGSIHVTDGSFSWSGSSSSDGEDGHHALQTLPTAYSAANAGTNPNVSTPQRDALTNVTLSIQPGQLVAVVGPTGSGKSALLHALLGELHKTGGEVAVGGAVCYVPQQSWVPNASLRDVILFNALYNHTRYQHALDVCNLQQDLLLLQNGDQTEIGERGVNLSGGQKQRVSMARAVYANASIYLLDDPLSALDSDVGARLFADCIKYALFDKTRVLVTHNLAVLSQVDRIVLMGQSEGGEGCRVLDQGTLSELLQRGHDLKKYVHSSNATDSSGAAAPADTTADALHFHINVNTTADPTASVYVTCVPPVDAVEDTATAVTASLADITKTLPHTTLPVSADEIGLPIVDANALSGDRIMSTTHTVSVGAMQTPTSTQIADNKHITGMGVQLPATDTVSTIPSSSAAQSSLLPTKLISAEERVRGAVGAHVYSTYIRAANRPALLVLLALAVLVGNASQVLQQWLVVAWTADVGYAKRPLHAYLLGTVGMALFAGLFSYWRTYIGVLFGAAASNTMHRNMLERVMAAPLSYFESTPTGRLVQRFSKDLDQIDQQLPYALSQLISSSGSILTATAAIIAVTPAFSYALAAIAAVYFAVTNYYRTVARELKRLEAISRSPVFSHFAETLGGLSVIRAFRRQSVYLRTNEARLDENLSAFSTLKSVDRWLSVRLELLGNSIVLLSALLAVFTHSRAGAAGLSLNNALAVTSLLNWAVRNAAETEALMTSVERVAYTTSETPQEAPMVKQSIDASAVIAAPPHLSEFMSRSASEELAGGSAPQPASSVTLSDADLLRSGWPWEGALSLRNVRMRYRSDFEEVLKGVNLEIRPGERIGIVGRTGSGKSSLFRGLLRLTEIETGSILLDGVDVSKIGLNALRSSLSIIPQDPVLFSGSIRMNLDPFDAHSDGELWAALRKAKLDRTVLALPGALRHEVGEGGENFSQGQRQLLCLARALVRRSRVLLLDEATSSVDYETDALVQEAIRREFGDGRTTVLTIAHRLDSVLDADRIVVMEAGRVAETGSPGQLLCDRGSHLSRLVRADQLQREQQQG